MLNAAAGIYWRICVYDARNLAVRLRIAGGNMPVWLQNLTWINPVRHFTDITKELYLKDVSFDIIWHSLWPLLVITLTTGSAAYAMFRRKIA